MNKVTSDELNNAAMQMILHAGNCRNLLNEAVIETIDEQSEESVNKKLKEAKDEITIAHKIQTDMIQSTIEYDELQTTLLFTHAQDTLMTINSEVNMSNHIIRMYRKIAVKVGNL